MKHLICYLMLLASFGMLSGQQLSPEVVATAGDSFSDQNLSLDWTLGEIVTETFVGTIVLTQGFHQPALQTTAIQDEALSLGNIMVYPNPSSGSISIEREKSGELELRVWDIQGRILLQKKISAALSTLDLSHLPAGMYLLQMSDEKSTGQTVRIEKL